MGVWVGTEALLAPKMIFMVITKCTFLGRNAFEAQGLVSQHSLLGIRKRHPFLWADVSVPGAPLGE